MSIVFESGKIFIRRRRNDNYCLIAIDIEHLNYLMTGIIRQMGNKILGQIGLELQKIQK